MYVLQVTGANDGNIYSAVHDCQSACFRAFPMTDFNDHNIVPAAQYMITIVPEPTTLALIGMTAVGGAFIAHRRRVLKG